MKSHGLARREQHVLSGYVSFGFIWWVFVWRCMRQKASTSHLEEPPQEPSVKKLLVAKGIATSNTGTTTSSK